MTGRTSGPRRLRPTAVVALAALGLLATSVPALAAGSPALADATPGSGTGSAMTLSGGDEFPSLRVSVSKTRELGSEAVAVSWEGAAPTAPAEGKFYADYLQVMQCWGDPGAEGPQRDQCQFGTSDDLRGGYGAQLRRVFRSDPAEDFTGQPEGISFYSLPVRSVNGTSEVPAAANGYQVSYFSRQNTNEIPFARTNPAGQGQVFLEAQTALEAPWMGCGAAAGEGAAAGPRRCFLVVVPRGRTDADGTRVTNPSDGPDGQLLSSPMSASNWEDRIVFPLDFTPVDTRCTGSAEETPVVGTEVVSSAFRRWQPLLCSASQARYSYVEVADVIAEGSITRGDGELVFTPSAFDAGLFAEGTQVEYAPVSLSGIGIAVLVEQVVAKSPDDFTEDDLRRTGTRVQEVRLTPRLVAKLLTQSYQAGAWIGAPQVADNPRDMGRDPEFQDLNPAFGDLSFVEPFVLGDALTPASSGGAVETLWRWVMADPQARAWLDGAPDEDGMVVNPAYEGLEEGLDFFPRRDPECLEPGPSQPDVPDGIRLCALDLHPYVSDLQASARYASRGDLAATVFNTGYVPGQLTPYRNLAQEPALSGRRAALAITDTVSAQRYQLPMASLRNAAGEFVAPTATSLTTALDAMVPSPDDSQVLEVDLDAEVAGAYATPVLTYAALVPADTTPARGALYADVVAYAVGDGQALGEQVGQLPRGYAPLPPRLREAAVRSATTMREQAGVQPAVPTTPTTPAPTPVDAPPLEAGYVPPAVLPYPTTPPAAPLLGPPLPLLDAPSAPASAPVPAATALAEPLEVELAATRTRTLGADPSTYRWLLVVLAGLGLASAAAGPLTLVLARRRRPASS